MTLRKKTDHSQRHFQLWQILQQQALRKSFFLTLWKENIMTMSRIINVLFLKNSNYFWLILRNNGCNNVVASCNTSFCYTKKCGKMHLGWYFFYDQTSKEITAGCISNSRGKLIFFLSKCLCTMFHGTHAWYDPWIFISSRCQFFNF